MALTQPLFNQISSKENPGIGMSLGSFTVIAMNNVYLTHLKENWWLLYQQHLLITISVACLQTSRARNSFEGITGSGSVSPRIC